SSRVSALGRISGRPGACFGRGALEGAGPPQRIRDWRPLMIARARAFEGSRVRPEDLKSFCVQAMVASGLSERHAEETAEVLVTTDTWGTFTHGTRQILPLMNNVRAGAIRADAEPKVVAEGPAWALLEGNYAMPMVTSRLA